MKSKLIAIALVSSCAVWAAPVQAMLCSAGTATEGISVSNMTYNGANASNCYGVVAGNINSATQVDGIFGADLWTQIAQADDTNVTPGVSGSDSGSFMGIDFTLNWAAGTPNTWTLTGIDTNGSAPLNIPTSLDFVGALKGGNEYALWFFDDVVFDGNDGGTWSIVFTNNGGQVPDLSHLSLFVREGGGVIPPVVIPEPASLALLGLGLFGLGAMRRRRS